MKIINLVLSVILLTSVIFANNKIYFWASAGNGLTHFKQGEAGNSDSTNTLHSKNYSDNILNYSDLSSAVKTIGSGTITLTIPEKVNVNANIKVPNNITLNFINGGALNIDAKSKVIINGYINAPHKQIFYGGKIILGAASNNIIYPEWWGAGISNSPVVNREAINNAIFSLSQRESGTIYFSGGNSDIYKVDGTLLCISGTVWDGNAVLRQDAGASVPLIKIEKDSNITFMNLTLDGNSTGKKISEANIVSITNSAQHIYFKNIKFNYFKYDAVSIHGTGDDKRRSDNIKDIEFDKCTFNCDPRINYIPIYVAGVERLTVKDCTFKDVQFSAIELAGGYNKYAQIINNKFYMEKLGHWCVEAIGAVEYAVISGNQSVCSLSGGGISTHLRYSTVINNHIIKGVTGSDRSGTEISGSNNNISGNIIDNGTLAVISDGTVAITVEYSGIRSSYDTLFCHDNIISNNIVTNKSGGAGINIYFDPSVVPPYDTISNILISNNTVIEANVKGASPRAYYLGLHRSKLSNIVLSNNVASSDSNIFINNGTAFYLAAPYGSHDIKMINNSANNYQYGFVADTAYYYNIVLENNDLKHCANPVINPRKIKLFNSEGKDTQGK